MINPILDRELKTRMRTWRTPMMLTVYLVGIGLIVGIIAFSSLANTYYRGFDPSVIPIIYDVLIGVQMFLLMLIVPVMTATAISGERQRQTLDLMLCTDISPWKILFGKIYATLTFVLLLVFATIPFMGTVLLFGGISIMDIFQVIIYYMATSFMLACIGIFASTHFKKNTTAIIVSYGIMALLYLMPILVISTFAISSNFRRYVALENFIDKYTYEVFAGLFGSNPGFGLMSLMNNDIFDIAYLTKSSLTFIGKIPPWTVSSFFFVIISAVALLLSKRRLSRLK